MSDNAAQYSYWRAELSKPGLLSRDTTDPVAGFWRLTGAKTKPDYPCAIWYSPEGEPIWSVGRQRPEAGETDAWHEFMGMTFPKAVAVTDEEYHRALDTGFWGDGKPSRKMTEEERLGIDTGSGDNAAPVEETLADQIATLAEKARSLPEPKTQAEADAATVIVDRLRALWKKADMERDAEKRPHDEASKAVQAKWLPIMEPAKVEGAALDERRRAFLRKEQARLDAAAAEERRRIMEESLAESARMTDLARKEAMDRGEDPNSIAEPEISVPEVVAPRATAGGAFGRNSGLKKVRIGYVDDAAKLAAHFIETEDEDFAAYLDKRVKAAARSKVTLPGMVTKEELK